MEALAILRWAVVLIADLAFMANIKRLADALFPLDAKKRQPRAGYAQRLAYEIRHQYYTTRSGGTQDVRTLRPAPGAAGDPHAAH